MLSVSMDGPAVNWKFMDLLQLEHGEHFGGFNSISMTVFVLFCLYTVIHVDLLWIARLALIPLLTILEV